MSDSALVYRIRVRCSRPQLNMARALGQQDVSTGATPDTYVVVVQGRRHGPAPPEWLGASLPVHHTLIIVHTLR